MGITVMEVILLIVSAACFVVSFLIPETKESGVDEELAQEEIRGLIRQEMEGIRGNVEELVGESMNYAMEKTERSLERVSNEKIMAVSEYSDTVMQEIHRNHEEVVFLYDMLNTKQETLKKTVAEASKAAKTMQDTVESIQTFRPVEVSYGEGSVKIAPVAAKRKKEGPVRERLQEKMAEVKEDAVYEGLNAKERENEAENGLKQEMESLQNIIKSEKNDRKEAVNDSYAGRAPILGSLKTEETVISSESRNDVNEVPETVDMLPDSSEKTTAAELLNVSYGDSPVAEIQPGEVQLGVDGNRNSNERILELHSMGKSNVAIAKELGLGVGEVKLVIDLYKNL